LTQVPTVGPTSVSALLPGLQPDTTYHFRVVAKNGFGTTIGNQVEFKTPVAVKSVITEDATQITRTTATLNGSYDGATNDTPPGPLEDFYYYFEWGETSAYGNSTATAPGTNAGAHAEIVKVSAPISGLSVQLPTSLPYHYRLVVTNGAGTTYGPDHRLFSAPPDLPQISGTTANNVSPTGADLAAVVNPGEGETSYLFEYGLSASYGLATPIAGPLEGDVADHPINQSLDGLLPGTTYHYRAVAFNFGGTTHGPDQTFTTPDAPEVDSSGSSGITQTTAHLTADVIANASATNVHFDYGTGTDYGSSTPSIDAGTEPFRRIVGSDLTGLSPGTTYHFRAVAANGLGTTAGSDMTFTTLPAQTAEPAPRPKCRKGFVRKHGKCVKRHQRNRKHHRRNG
jgi:hypothetical protein